jgi:hypothetical protein
MITGHADTQPRAPNDSVANRALNRRIDITLVTNRDRHGTFGAPAGTDEDTDLVPVAAAESGEARDLPGNDPASSTSVN